MNNRYFQLPIKEKRKIHIKLLLSSLFIVVSIGIILYVIDPKYLLLIALIIPILISIIAPFFDVPSLVEKRKLKYYSLFLLAEQEENKTIKIHGGTLFDYYFVFHKEMTKQERKKVVLLEYLKGLKHLVHDSEEDVKIQGTSYIINERTANKLGLKKISTNGIQNLILIFNYINILISISLVNKSIVFPNLNKVQTFEGKVSDIKQRNSFINNLIEKLERTTINKAQISYSRETR